MSWVTKLPADQPCLSLYRWSRIKRSSVLNSLLSLFHIYPSYVVLVMNYKPWLEVLVMWWAFMSSKSHYQSGLSSIQKFLNLLANVVCMGFECIASRWHKVNLDHQFQFLQISQSLLIWIITWQYNYYGETCLELNSFLLNWRAMALLVALVDHVIICLYI